MRAPVLGTAPASGRLKSGVGLKVNGFKAISREDLAAFMLEQIDAPAYVGKKPVVYQG